MLSYEQRSVPHSPSRLSHGSPSTQAHSPSQTRMSNGVRPRQEQRHIWMVTGPAGCGKSTVAKHLAQNLSLPFLEGDDFHPESNVQKMAAGTPLTDDDRWEWLELLRHKSLAELAGGAPGVVLTCSALKKKYRDVIRQASDSKGYVQVHFVYLRAEEKVLCARVRARQGHFMKDDMVKSQFKILEEPNRRTERDCLIVDVGGTAQEVQELALAAVKRTLEKANDDSRRR